MRYEQIDDSMRRVHGVYTDSPYRKELKRKRNRFIRRNKPKVEEDYLNPLLNRYKGWSV